MTVEYLPRKSLERVGAKQIAKELAMRTGLPSHPKVKLSSLLVVQNLVEIIVNHLAAGREVQFENLGTWKFRYRKGRKAFWVNHLGKGKSLISEQPDRWYVTFQTSKRLRSVSTQPCDSLPEIGTNTGLTLDGAPQWTEPPPPNLVAPTPPFPEPSIHTLRAGLPLPPERRLRPKLEVNMDDIASDPD